MEQYEDEDRLSYAIEEDREAHRWDEPDPPWAPLPEDYLHDLPWDDEFLVWRVDAGVFSAVVVVDEGEPVGLFANSSGEHIDDDLPDYWRPLPEDPIFGGRR